MGENKKVFDEENAKDDFQIINHPEKFDEKEAVKKEQYTITKQNENRSIFIMQILRRQKKDCDEFRNQY